MYLNNIYKTSVNLIFELLFEHKIKLIRDEFNKKEEKRKRK